MKEFLKKSSLILFAISFFVLLSGCGRDIGHDSGNADNKSDRNNKGSIIVGEDIKEDDIGEFYYTIENINLDAYYIRYRFYTDDGKHMFFFEERLRPDDYGPTTEKDTIAKTEFEISNKVWLSFYDTITGGTVCERDDDPEDGDNGPWTYLYWSGDGDKYQKYSFGSQSSRKEFEQLCEKLVEKSGVPAKSEEELKNIPVSAQEAFEDFVEENFTLISGKKSFVTERDEERYYYTDYPQELFGVMDYYIGDLDDDNEDELLVISMSNDDADENILLSVYEYNNGRVEIADIYEYDEKMLEADEGNTFLFLYRDSNYPVIGIMTRDYYYTRADGVNIIFTALNYGDEKIQVSDSDEYRGSDTEDNGFSKVFKRNGIDITWEDLFEDDMQDRMISACNGKLLAELILGLDDMEEEDYIPVRLYRHAEVYGYCGNESR